MRIQPLNAALSAVVACSFGLVQPARADIYTWVDASGTIHISNLSPPDGVRITNVTHETAQDPESRIDAAREAARQAELQELSDRVRQLENEADVARRPVPPPQVVYVQVPVPPPVQYPVEMAPPASGGCDPSWAGCWGWWGSGFYPASIVVVGTPKVQRSPHRHSGHGAPVQRPVRGPLGFRER
jgi:hypothetical protein